uniref:Uncharacterized protein n=1 Tax=Anguilla anguilla TaxID=7936 RepID=A0A0E9SIB8_ANGAN
MYITIIFYIPTCDRKAYNNWFGFTAVSYNFAFIFPFICPHRVSHQKGHV